MKPQPITRNHVSVEGRALRAALSPILRIIERRTSYPILSNVRLTYAASTLTLVGTDLDIMITTTLDVNDGEGGFDICLDPRILSGIARVAGPALVQIGRVERLQDGLKPTLQAEARVTIGDDTSYTLPVLNADTFPELPGKRGDLIERFTNGSLGTMLAKVAPFISTEETRYYLNGVCWSDGERGRRFAATDGHRLGICSYMADKGQPVSRIIPRKTVHLLMALVQGQDVAIYSIAGKEKPQLEITMGRTTIRTKLIEGTFPDIDRVIPALDTAPFKLDMNRVEILAAIDRVMIMGSNRFGRAIRWFNRDGNLALSVNNADTGSSEATVATAMPEDAPDFGLNGSYIRDLIARSQGNVTLHVKDAGSPFRLTDEDETMTRVCMPMRV